MSEEFFLMNKDSKLASLKVSMNKVYIDNIYLDTPQYLYNIDAFIGSRLTPVSRANISALLKQAQIVNQKEFMEITRAISLTDTFWVNSSSNPTTWSKVNPYKNRFSRIISDIALNYNYTGGFLRSPSPEYTVDGSADKCWKRENGEIFLYKTDGERWSGLAGLRPYCEYYATQVAAQLGIHNFIKYGISFGKTVNGYIKPYARSKIFTSEQFGYVPIAYTKYCDMELTELYKTLDDSGRLTLREMLLFDSIIVNFDRHQGNYGLMFDTNNFDVIGMAPVFDQDCSLGALLSIQYKTKNEAYKELITTRLPKTNLGGYIKQARMSLTSELKQNMINMYPFHFKRLPKEVDLEDERIEFMEYIVNMQIKAILGR